MECGGGRPGARPIGARLTGTGDAERGMAHIRDPLFERHGSVPRGVPGQSTPAVWSINDVPSLSLQWMWEEVHSAA